VTVSLDVGVSVSEDDGTVQVCDEGDMIFSLTTSNETGKCKITIFTVEATGT
jgi:hypothetical protein